MNDTIIGVDLAKRVFPTPRYDGYGACDVS